MDRTNEIHNSEKRCYTVKEVQDILGVCRATVYNLIKMKVFRTVQLDGRIYRISKKSFDEWLDSRDPEDLSFF